ncbi:MAG: 4Fe-4S binding protein [Ignavibacteria bacterium]|nr:4Fe-4S binding protein [Ignavibacteria bacterium]
MRSESNEMMSEEMCVVSGDPSNLRTAGTKISGNPIRRESIAERSSCDIDPAALTARPDPKKIPAQLRKEFPRFQDETRRHRKILIRLKEDSQFARSTVQLSFALLCIWIGIEFAFFVKWGMSGGTAPFVGRPPGVEGFLPISALISLKYWLHTGVVNSVHPSGLFILVAIVVVSLLLKKAFCSWLCPIGTLSESLWLLGQRLFGRNLKINRWIDYPLRSLKYFLLLFFVYSIWQMDVAALKTFIDSPYNKMADVKMYMFFADITTFALWTIIILALLSVVVKNFWCRYLCPYGALLGAVSWLSPLKITRDVTTCIDCELCTKACPSGVKVHAERRVWSDECMACLSCVEACPVKECLSMKSGSSARATPRWVFATLIVGVFVAITGMAMLAGKWHNGISNEEYLRRFQNINTPLYQHSGGEVPAYGPND